MATYRIVSGSGTPGSGTYRGPWVASTAFAVGDRVSATYNYGGGASPARAYMYECTTAGTTGASEPAWVYTTPDTSTTTSGGAVFTCRNMTTWANAGVQFEQGQLKAAAGDVVLIHYQHQDEYPASKSYNFTSGVSYLSVDKNNSDALTAMGTSGWIGHGTNGYYVNLGGTAAKVYFWGLTFRISSGISQYVGVAAADGAHHEFENCLIYFTGTGNHYIQLGTGASAANSFALFKNCTLQFSAVGQNIYPCGHLQMEGGSVTTTAPTTFISAGGATGGNLYFEGVDLSLLGSGKTLLGSQYNYPMEVYFSRCKLGASVTPFATQTPANKSSAHLYMFDCSVAESGGGANLLFAYYDSFGSVVSDTGTYFTSGAAAQSWKITTTANCSYYTPFVTPWVDLYHSGTSAITPYFEVLRNDGTATKRYDDTAWAEFAAKKTSGEVTSTFYSDRCSLANKLAATPSLQADGAGTGSWTIGSSNSPASFKCDSGTSITPAEVGHLRGRLVVGVASATLYLDPQIRT